MYFCRYSVCVSKNVANSWACYSISFSLLISVKFHCVFFFSIKLIISPHLTQVIITSLKTMIGFENANAWTEWTIELPQIRRDFILEKCVSEMPRAFIAWCTGRWLGYVLLCIISFIKPFQSMAMAYIYSWRNFEINVSPKIFLQIRV